MDRQIVYPGAIPLDTDLLGAQRDAMIAIGYLAQTVLGTATVVDGLGCTSTQPASMMVTVGSGCITQFGAIDATPFGSLPALAANPLVRIGVNIGSTSFLLTAPSAVGQIVNYLVQASLLEADSGATVLPYYNATSPSVPFSGPGNDGQPQMTMRQQTVQLACKPGPAVATGNQTLPAVDAGWVGLYVITVGYGQSSVSSGNISTLPTAPFLNWKMPQLTPGTRNLAVFKPSNQGVWSVPSGVGVLRLRIWGGGGAGGSGFGGAGGGGAGGGYSEGYYSVTAGQAFNVSVGNGGIGTGAGGTGQAASFGGLASATGGMPGATGGPSVGGLGATGAGTGAGSGLVIPGAPGGDALGLGGAWISGAGGGAYGSCGALASIGASSAVLLGRNGIGPGSGGSGGLGSGVGGQGGPGLVLAEW